MGFGLLVTLGSVKLWWAFSHLFLHLFQKHFPSFALQIYILGVFCLSFLLWLISNYIKANHLWCTYVTNTTYSWFSGKLNWCNICICLSFWRIAFFFVCFCSFYSRAFEDLFTFVYFWLPLYDELKNWLQKETYANI